MNRHDKSTLSRLSDRNQRLLELVAQGHASPYIATELCISTRYADELIADLMAYAGVSRRPALVDWGHRMGHLGGEAA
jgi:DNA-binding CsgD family transcriptional regulator